MGSWELLVSISLLGGPGAAMPGYGGVGGIWPKFRGENGQTQGLLGASSGLEGSDRLGQRCSAASVVLGRAAPPMSADVCIGCSASVWIKDKLMGMLLIGSVAESGNSKDPAKDLSQPRSSKLDAIFKESADVSSTASICMMALKLGG